MPLRLKTSREAASIKKPGKHSLGGNVYLQISHKGSRSYVARITDHSGRRRDIGLGSAKLFSLAQARDKAQQARIAAAIGNDPIKALKGTTTPTFEQLARQIHAERATTFRNAKHRAQWVNTLEAYAFPFIGQLSVDRITSSDVLALLRPIWVIKQETARRVLQRVAFVVSYAVPAGYRESELPVRAIRAHLPPQKNAVRHHPAVSFQQAPQLYAALAGQNSMSAYALRLLFLTASRSQEVREARWSEFDFETNVWIVPAERMKKGLQHRVPLSPHAVELLTAIPRSSLATDLVFPNNRGKPLSDTALSKVLKRSAPGCTVHGCRSTFKDWAIERTDYADEVSELALAHVNNDKTRAAYARSDLFERRRLLMNDWAAYCCGSGACGTVTNPILAAPHG